MQRGRGDPIPVQLNLVPGSERNNLKPHETHCYIDSVCETIDNQRNGLETQAKTARHP